MWRYVYRAVDQHGQVIDVLVSKRRDTEAARRFFTSALSTLKVRPTEVVTDRAAVYPRVLDELIPAAWHHIEQYENNRIEADHSRLKQRLRPMRGVRTDRTAQVIIAGLAFVQNIRRGHAGAENVVRAGQAARWYSWMIPPRRSRRRMARSRDRGWKDRFRQWVQGSGV